MLEKVTTPVKKFVNDHKVAITATVTAAICLAISKSATNQHDDFLKEKGLYDEFYDPERN